MDEGFNMRKRKSSSSSSQQSRKNTALSKRARRNPKSTHNTQHNTKKPSLELFWNLPSFLSKGDDAVCRRVSEQCNSKRRRLRLCNNTAAAATSVCAVLMMWRKIKVFPSSLRRSKTIKNHLNFTFTFEFTLFSASLTARVNVIVPLNGMKQSRNETCASDHKQKRRKTKRAKVNSRAQDRPEMMMKKARVEWDCGTVRNFFSFSLLWPRPLLLVCRRRRRLKFHVLLFSFPSSSPLSYLTQSLRIFAYLLVAERRLARSVVTMLWIELSSATFSSLHYSLSRLSGKWKLELEN